MLSRQAQASAVSPSSEVSAAAGASSAGASAILMDEAAEIRLAAVDNEDLQHRHLVMLEREMRAVQVEVSDAVMVRLVREVVADLQEVERRRGRGSRG